MRILKYTFSLYVFYAILEERLDVVKFGTSGSRKFEKADLDPDPGQNCQVRSTAKA
jgi:hypothetical protein